MNIKVVYKCLGTEKQGVTNNKSDVEIVGGNTAMIYKLDPFLYNFHLIF